MDFHLHEGLLPILDLRFTQQLTTAQIIEQFLEANYDYFILRPETRQGRDLTAYLDELKAMTRNLDFNFILNKPRSVDDAEGLLGVHLSRETLSVYEARKELLDSQIIGYTAHSLDDALEAEGDGADYILFGPVFRTRIASAHHAPLGLEQVNEAARTLTIPVFAYGGITQENIIEVKNTGVYGFSSLEAVYENDSIEHNATKLGLMWDDLA